MSKSKQNTDRAFFDIEEQPARLPMDRSTLEAWATCPFLGNEIEQGNVKVVGAIAESGEVSHQAMMAAVRLWIDLDGQCSLSDLRTEVENAMLGARPDLQPDVISAIRGAIWDWCSFVRTLRPDEIEGFDGGEDIARGGQLAMQLSATVDYTLELDLLHRGPSPDVLHIKDLKTGWKELDAGGVRASFQFQSQALLVMHNYPSILAVEVEIWNTRLRRFSRRVVFERHDLLQFKARVCAAYAARVEARAQTEVPTWPTSEKCPICPCASYCPAADRVVKRLGTASDADLLSALVQAEAQYEVIKQTLTARRDERGTDIHANGLGFGREKPAAARKSPAALYQLKEQTDA
jgi:hypothetical protein